MPPRKRKAAEQVPESQSQPQKRVTRSSTIRKDEATSSQPKESTTTKSKPSKAYATATKAEPKKTPKTSSNTAKQSKKATSNTTTVKGPEDRNTKAQAKSSSQSNDNAASKDFEPITITSDLIKSPLQCHSYPGPSPITSPPLIFIHGAGGDCSAAAVVNFCTGFSTRYPILAFNGSMNLVSRVKGFHACIQHLSNTQDGQGRLKLGGRSMGARAAVMAASEVLSDDAKTEVSLILASYPLQGPKDVRDQILLDLPSTVRVLFVIGDRDAMCPLDMLEGVRKKMRAGNQLVVVRGADHGMHVRPAKREREVGEETGRVVAEWVGGKVEGDVMYVGGDEDDDG